MFRSAMGRMKGWLLQEDEEPRRAPRSMQPEVVVYYWDGSAPEGRRIHDISQSGAYICTPDAGTSVRLSGLCFRVSDQGAARWHDGSRGFNLCIGARGQARIRRRSR